MGPYTKPSFRVRRGLHVTHQGHSSGPHQGNCSFGVGAGRGHACQDRNGQHGRVSIRASRGFRIQTTLSRKEKWGELMARMAEDHQADAEDHQGYSYIDLCCLFPLLLRVDTWVAPSAAPTRKCSSTLAAVTAALSAERGEGSSNCPARLFYSEGGNVRSSKNTPDNSSPTNQHRRDDVARQLLSHQSASTG